MDDERATQYRLELILMGMALAKEGDREKILESMAYGDMENTLPKTVVEAIRQGDGDMVRECFATLGVTVGSSVRAALVDDIKQMTREKMARKLIEEILMVNDVGTLDWLQKKLEHALDEVRKVRSDC